MKPYHPLGEVKRLIQEGNYDITTRASMEGAFDFGLDDRGMISVILSLEDSDFEKTLEGKKKKGLMQDVYKKDIGGKDAYIKLQILMNLTVVISFHEYT